MNLSHTGSSEALETKNRSRDVAAGSGVCTRCMADCHGNCDVFKSSFRGREVIYPVPFGEMTAGGDKQFPVDYSHLNILGFAMGAKAIDEANPDKAIFPVVDTTAVYGHMHPVRMRMPVFTGALGSTDIARKYWESFAIGAAISGISVVVGENVCGIDPETEFSQAGRIIRSPEMERRVKIYKDWQEDFGDIIVQLNVEDTNFGVAEYVVEKLGVETIELKWGQGAKCIGGEIKIRDLDRAIELQKRGYIITPNPSIPAVRQAFEGGGIKEFERHSRLGFIEEEQFLRTVEYLRRTIGVKRVTLKTGAYSYPELARAIKWSSKARIDLVTIDGSGGGTGMSPWRMMEEWGVPTFYLQAMAYECAKRLATRGEWTPDLANGRWLLHRGSHLQSAGHGSALLQGGLHGPGSHDPRFRRDQYRGGHAQGRAHRSLDRAASGGQEVRADAGRGFRHLLHPERKIRPEGRDDAAGRRGRLYLHRQAAHGSDPVHGWGPELPFGHLDPHRPRGSDGASGQGLSHPVRDGRLQG